MAWTYRGNVWSPLHDRVTKPRSVGAYRTGNGTLRSSRHCLIYQSTSYRGDVLGCLSFKHEPRVPHVVHVAYSVISESDLSGNEQLVICNGKMKLFNVSTGNPA